MRIKGLLAAAEGGSGCDFKDPITWIFLALIVLALAWFVFSGSRRKKQAQEAQNNLMTAIQLNVYVMTQGGVIGKVVEIKVISATEKHVVLETGGDEHKSYITYDIRAIMTVLRPEQLVAGLTPIEPAMPSDEEIQKRLDEGYSAKPAETANETTEAVPAAEAVFETPEAVDTAAAVETPAVEAAPKTAKPKAVVKKAPAKKPAKPKTEKKPKE